MLNSLHIRLSVMMFLQFFIWGAWFVTLGTYLSYSLNFDGTQIGSAYSANPLAAMISPLIVGFMAGKLLSTRNMLASLHLGGAVLLYFASQATEFSHVYALLLGYSLCYMPTLALSASLCFQSIEHPSQHFPYIRVFGTLGWIAAGLSVGFWDVEETNLPLQLSAVASLVLGAYCFSLPQPKAKEQATLPASQAGLKSAFGFDALSLLKNREFLVLFIGSMLVCIPLAFYYNFTNLFLNDLNVENAAGKMTIGQMSEVLFMLLMPLMFKRLGYKKMLLIGVAAWSIRYGLFAYNSELNLWPIYIGIALHGICYDFFFVTGQVFADKKAPHHLKDGAQSLMTFCTYGVGMFIGSHVSGYVVEHYTEASGILWTQVWLVPAAMAIGVFVLLAALFKEPKAEQDLVTERAKADSA
ncbi:nucleoside permease [Ningiella sp. W23]|uniref:nucleoside permease n=1 Tax=Ningiella sp. W23 TaxID=3023715 RepID=UPI003757E048